MPSRRQHGEGSLYQRGKRGGRGGQWVAVADLGWRNGKRDRREFTGATMEAAKERRQKFLDRRRDGFVMPKGRQPYVSEWMLHWLHNVAKRKVRATTWHRSYRQKVTDHIVPFFERTPLPELDEELIEEFHAHLEDKGLSPATITQVHRIMSRALKVAVVRKRIGRNPCSNVSPPQVRRHRSEPPSAVEARRILAACGEWPAGPRWILAAATGMRQGEVLGLAWPQVVLTGTGGSVHVEQELVRLPWQHGCDPPCGLSARRCPARHGGGLVLTEPKSEKSVRWISFGPWTATSLKRQRQAQLAARLAAGPAWTGWDQADLVFTGPYGAPVDPRRDWQDWQDLLASLGIGHYRVHDIRHGTATALLEAGLDIRVVQEIMGHASPHFTREVYQHVTPSLHQAAADAMDRVLRGD